MNSSRITKEKGLTSRYICEIISQCGESGVTEFNFKELHISFQDKKDVCNEAAHTQSPGQVTAIDENMMDTESFIRQDEMDAKDEELAEMKIQDPFGYETLLAQKELESGE